MKGSALVLKISCSFMLIIIQFFLNTRMVAQVKTGANEVRESVQTEDTISVWAAPAELKIRPADEVQVKNLVYSGNIKKIKVAGAGNEHVAFQVVLTHPVPPGRRPPAPKGFFIEGTELRSKQGGVIPRERISYYLEHYIMLYARSSPIGETGMWPDAIVPVKEPFSMAAQYAVVKNRPIWVDISIPANTPAGTYTGSVTVTRDGKKLETLQLELEVYGFSIPDTTSLITYMNISKNWLAHFYHKDPSSAEMDKLTQTYYDFLYRYRMEPWFNDQLEPHVTLSGEKVELKFDDDRYNYYMNTLKSKRVLLEAMPRNLRRTITDEEFSPGFNSKVKAYLSQVTAYFRKNGWQNRLVFNSPVDEPNTKEEYEETRRWARLVHEAAPGIPFLSTESPVADNPEWGELRGHVDHFCIHGNALNSIEVKKAVREEQNKGGEMTWYISCDQQYPQPNYFIDGPGMDPVMVPWITACYSMAGFLYWGVNYWMETPNPWLDAVTFISGFLCSDGYVLNGEGSMIYPGNYVKQFTGQPDVNGPVSSVRFELLRDGIEDYDYITMLKNRGEGKFADSVVRKMVIDVSTFSRSVEELYSVRRAMARKIEEREPKNKKNIMQRRKEGTVAPR